VVVFVNGGVSRFNLRPLRTYRHPMRSLNLSDKAKKGHLILAQGEQGEACERPLDSPEMQRIDLDDSQAQRRGR
jgi:hypothetical protein